MTTWYGRLEEIDEFGEDLTPWEIRFVEDMVTKCKEIEYRPTDSQIITIEKIHGERVPA